MERELLARRPLGAARVIWLAPLLLVLALAASACGGAGAGPLPNAEPAAFETEDGLLIAGEVLRGGDAWVLLGHQNGANRHAWNALVTDLHAAGFTTLTWDFRGVGASADGDLAQIDADWRAAIDFAEQDGALSIYGVGASMGATSLLTVADEEWLLEGIVAVSAPLEFQGLDATRDANRVWQPGLFIAAARDHGGDYAAAAQVLADATGGRDAIAVEPGSAHGNRLISTGDTGAALRARIVNFLLDVSAGARNPLTLTADDGATFVAEVRRSETGSSEWVLLGHQFPYQGNLWNPLATRFHDLGYNVLWWDFRCHGVSPCHNPENDKEEDVGDIWRDWNAAVDYAVEQGASAVYALGASMGGTSAVQVAAERPEIVRVAAVSSPNRFLGLDALRNYERVTIPKLFIVGEDNLSAPEFSRRFHEEATGPSQLHVYPTDLHGNFLILSEEFGEEITEILVTFVQEGP